MNIKFTSVETLYLYELLSRIHVHSNTEEHDALVLKFKTSILNMLDDAKDRNDEDSYRLWLENETRKIDFLKDTGESTVKNNCNNKHVSCKRSQHRDT
jgi:3-deoxy-D-arabino-heptulosonate 7-phosphate (DAHP) synthase class II